MSREVSHGRVRVLRPRPRDAGTGTTAEERRRRDHASDGRFRSGNKAAAGRGAKRALARPERALRAALAKASQGLCESSEQREVLRDVVTLLRATCHELGSTSVLVVAGAVTFAREQVMAGIYFARALELGSTTPQGRELMELAHKCEARAERALLHARVQAEQHAPAAPASAPWLEAPSDDGGTP